MLTLKCVKNCYEQLSTTLTDRGVHRFSRPSAISKVSPNFSAHHSSSSAHLYALISFSFSETTSDKIRLWLMQLSFLRDRLHTCANFNRSSLRKRGRSISNFCSPCFRFIAKVFVHIMLMLSSYSFFSFSLSLFLFSSPFLSLFFSLYIHIIR